MGIPIPKIDVKAGGAFGLAAAVVGGNIRHLRNRSQDVSEASALERATAAENSNAQLTEEAQDHQRTKGLAEAQLSHKSAVQGLQRQLHDALEGRTAAEGRLQGQLAAEQQACSAVRKDLVAVQREMEGLVHRNHELERANTDMGEEAHQPSQDVAAQPALFWQVEKPYGCNAVQAQMERTASDAHDAAHLQQQVQQLQQQLQGKERLLGEVTDANKQAQEQVARTQAAPSPAQQDCRQPSTEHDLMVEAQITISTTQEEDRRLLHRVATAEGQVHHLESKKHTLSTKLADIQQQLPALQTQLESATGGEQSATATAERVGGQVKTLQGAAAELKRQLEQQSSQLSSQAADLGNTRLKLQETQAACKALEKGHARAWVRGSTRSSRLELLMVSVCAVAAWQLAEDNLVDTNEKLATFDKKLKAVTKKKEASSSRNSELQQQKADLEEQVQGLDEQLETARIQHEEAAGQNCYLVNQVEVLRTQLVGTGLEPACVEQTENDENHDALSIPELDTTASPGGLKSCPLSLLVPPWGHLTAGASRSNDEQILEEQVKEDRWKEVTRVPKKSKGQVLHNKLKQRSRGNAGLSDNREQSRLGNASNVLEVPRPRAR
ncbi:TPA: hypothetical protein ACH3X1_001875 [Trebouxia sp. C0004]